MRNEYRRSRTYATGGRSGPALMLMRTPVIQSDEHAHERDKSQHEQGRVEQHMRIAKFTDINERIRIEVRRTTAPKRDAKITQRIDQPQHALPQSQMKARYEQHPVDCRQDRNNGVQTFVE